MTPGVRRGVAGAGILVAVAAGLAVHFGLPDTAASDIAGDVLYAVVAYLLVVLVAPRMPVLGAALLAASWCVAVELFQLTGLPERWGEAFLPLMLVFGTVFDPRDLGIYVLTVAVVAGVDAAVRVALSR